MKKIIHRIIGCLPFQTTYWGHYYKFKECRECDRLQRQMTDSFGDNYWEDV